MVKDKRITIGPHTFIDFPKLSLKKVPAKVDTGADSSSIWASNIHEVNGRLSFTLFAPNSRFYSGEEITTRDFQTAIVRNSFGHAELRYKVRLLANVQGRMVQIRFTLANRGNNSFPVLIGRRTLHGRFIVDVSRAEQKQFNILVLKPKPVKPSGTIDTFFKELNPQKAKVKFTYGSYRDLVFAINGKKFSVKLNGVKDIASFDLVYFLIVGDQKDLASAAAQYLKVRGTPYIDKSAAEYYQSLNKLHQHVVLHGNGVRVPRTVFMDKGRLAEAYPYLREYLGSPFILKDIRGRKGRNNYLIETKKQFDAALRDSAMALVAQRFIPNVGDYRFLIFGQQIKLVIKRVAERGSHLNNVSSSAKASLVEQASLPASVKRKALKAAEALQIDVAGVDMVQDKKTGLWYCLEVNESPQLVSSSFVDQKQQAFTDYLIRKLLKL